MFLDDVRLLACQAPTGAGATSCAPVTTCCTPAGSPGGPTTGPMTVTPVALVTAPAAPATTPAAAAMAPLGAFTPEVTRVALALTPQPTPTSRSSIDSRVTPTPTPAPPLLTRLWRQFSSRLPQGWQRALLVAVLALALLVLVWRATRGSTDGA
ncbi:MAG: hypothetical protein AUK03_09810 [Anaerolineae bacterium CG2_30_64_16]|nr:MAG: hypothetical protein AUK03_09810 [Anaerolineae bacterium CG2_30_64_16]